MSRASLTPRIDAMQKQVPSWLIYSLLTIILWGIWGATSKAVANDINAYMNQVLFTIGLIALRLLVIRSPCLAGGKNRRRDIFYSFFSVILGGKGNSLFFTS